MNVTERPARPTLADVAAQAGVSQATVSRALADSPLVNEQTRRRVCSFTSGLSASARDTVAGDTPAWAATSASVGRGARPVKGLRISLDNVFSQAYLPARLQRFVGL